MTEETKPRRHRARPEMPALRPGLWFVDRFGAAHDVSAEDWRDQLADADLAALLAYLEVTTAHARRAQALREDAHQRAFDGYLKREPDLSDVGPPFARSVDDERDEALNRLAAKLNVPADVVRHAATSSVHDLAEEVQLPPEVLAKVDEALADPAAFVAARTRPATTQPVFAEPEIIEETLGTKPATARPPMPWDDDAKDDPWASTPAS